jgi:hypothetical protein
MDLILRAQQKRDQLRAELARIEAFLATAFELEQELSASGTTQMLMTDAAKADAPERKISRSRGGAGADTLRAVTEILEERGQSMSTRDLLPLVRAKGVEVGGKDPVATLSARISQKGVVELVAGRWALIHNDEGSGAVSAGVGETADIPGKDPSAVSLFNSSEGERRDAAALAR